MTYSYLNVPFMIKFYYLNKSIVNFDYLSITPSFSLTALHSTDPGWYSSLTGQLDKEQQKEIQDVMTTADQRKALEGKRKIS